MNRKQNMIAKQEVEAFELAVLREMIRGMAGRLAARSIQIDIRLGFKANTLKVEINKQIADARQQAETNVNENK